MIAVADPGAALDSVRVLDLATYLAAPLPDYLAGVFGAVGALVALRHAERTGEGQVSIWRSTSRSCACSTT